VIVKTRCLECDWTGKPEKLTKKRLFLIHDTAMYGMKNESGYNAKKWGIYDVDVGYE